MTFTTSRTSAASGSRLVGSPEFSGSVRLSLDWTGFTGERAAGQEKESFELGLMSGLDGSVRKNMGYLI